MLVGLNTFIWKLAKAKYAPCGARIFSLVRAICKVFLSASRILSLWAIDIWGNFKGRRGYLTVGSIVAAYLTIFGLIDSKATVEESRASFERGAFLALVGAENPASFVTGLKEFGFVQTMGVTAHPDLLRFWTWNQTGYPNREPLLNWARWRLPFCQRDVKRDCSIRKPDDPDVPGWVSPPDDGESEAPRIDFSGANLAGADLSRVNLNYSNFAGANMHGMKLDGADLDRSYLRGVDLTSADLRCASLANANLKQAKLTGANVSDAEFINSNMEHANLDGITGVNVGLMSTDLSEASVRNAHLENADFEQYFSTVFSTDRTKVSGADLSGSDFRDAHFNDAESDEKTVWLGANLAGAAFFKSGFPPKGQGFPINDRKIIIILQHPEVSLEGNDTDFGSSEQARQSNCRQYLVHGQE